MGIARAGLLAVIGLPLAAQFAAAGAAGFNYQFPNLGSAPPTITAMAVDATGNTYVTGNLCTATLPVTAGAFQTQLGGGFCGMFELGGDAFVIKFDPTGAVVWATYLGGSGYDAGNAIAVDAAGNVYVAGETASQNFPVTAGAAFPNLTTSSDGFVVKLNPAGSQMIYGTWVALQSRDTAATAVLDWRSRSIHKAAPMSSAQGVYQSLREHSNRPDCKRRNHHGRTAITPTISSRA